MVTLSWAGNHSHDLLKIPLPDGLRSVYLAELNRHFSYHQVLVLCFPLGFIWEIALKEKFLFLSKLSRFLKLPKLWKKPWGVSPSPLSIHLEFHLLKKVPSSAQGSASRQTQAAAAPLQGYRIRPGQAESLCQLLWVADIFLSAH